MAMELTRIKLFRPDQSLFIGGKYYLRFRFLAIYCSTCVRCDGAQRRGPALEEPPEGLSDQAALASPALAGAGTNRSGIGGATSSTDWSVARHGTRLTLAQPKGGAVLRQQGPGFGPRLTNERGRQLRRPPSSSQQAMSRSRQPK